MAKTGMGGENGMSPRKSMAMGKTGMGGETFGVTPGLYNAGEHPDRNMSHDPLDDGERAIGHRGGMGIKHSEEMHPAQAAPDHGPMNIRGK